MLDLMKLEIETPSHLIDVNRLTLSKVETFSDGGVLYASATTGRLRRVHAGAVRMPRPAECTVHGDAIGGRRHPRSPRSVCGHGCSAAADSRSRASWGGVRATELATLHDVGGDALTGRDRDDLVDPSRRALAAGRRRRPARGPS